MTAPIFIYSASGFQARGSEQLSVTMRFTGSRRLWTTTTNNAP